MGKSATGKDTIYHSLSEDTQLSLGKIVLYTTRPIREGEEDGREYFFCDEQRVQQLAQENRIIELRAYDTVHGVWKYLTVDDGQVDLERRSYLVIGTLESYRKIRDFYGAASVIPIYIEVEDGERLLRAVSRERKQEVPKYRELCRRFLADSEDFSEENLLEAGITKRFINDSLEEVIDRIREYILQIEDRGPKREDSPASGQEEDLWKSE